KEMSDHLTSARMRILEILIVLTAGGTGYTALQQIKTTNNNDQFLFLQLFTTAREPLPAFAGFLGFLVPLVAIALAFDSVNGEFNRRTISRVLSQPIYRDALLLGKFLGAFFTLALVLAAIWLLIFGIGLLGLGIPPSGQETARILIFLLLTIFYGGFWLALGLLFSTLFRQAATAALASIGVWLFFIAFWEILVSLIAQGLRPIEFGVVEEIVARAKFEMMLSRISPNTLFAEATIGILNPKVRTLGLILPFELEGAIIGSTLPVEQSFLMIWPYLTGLIAITILLFSASYVSFQRKEIRA
ncbi:MAG: ABC transporter permease subunit, partial [Chloroflexota bacterium]|nr:ABC transporter permease subunit [Chloroflexota bacterium]